MNLLHINMDIGYASMKLRNRSWGMAYQWRRSKIILVSTEQREWRIWPIMWSQIIEYIGRLGGAMDKTHAYNT